MSVSTFVRPVHVAHDIDAAWVEVQAHNTETRVFLGVRDNNEYSQLSTRDASQAEPRLARAMEITQSLYPASSPQVQGAQQTVHMRMDSSGTIHSMPFEQSNMARHTRGGDIGTNAALVLHNDQYYIEVQNNGGGYDTTAWLKEQYPGSGWLGRGEKPLGFADSPMVAHSSVRG